MQVHESSEAIAEGNNQHISPQAEQRVLYMLILPWMHLPRLADLKAAPI